MLTMAYTTHKKKSEIERECRPIKHFIAELSSSTYY